LPEYAQSGWNNRFQMVTSSKDAGNYKADADVNSFEKFVESIMMTAISHDTFNSKNPVQAGIENVGPRHADAQAKKYIRRLQFDKENFGHIPGWWGLHRDMYNKKIAPFWKPTSHMEMLMFKADSSFRQIGMTLQLLN